MELFCGYVRPLSAPKEATLTPRVTGPMFATIGWGTYAFFAAMNIVIIFPTVYYLFPETKQRSLEDVSSGYSMRWPS